MPEDIIGKYRFTRDISKEIYRTCFVLGNEPSLLLVFVMFHSGILTSSHVATILDVKYRSLSKEKFYRLRSLNVEYNRDIVPLVSEMKECERLLEQCNPNKRDALYSSVWRNTKGWDWTNIYMTILPKVKDVYEVLKGNKTHAIFQFQSSEGNERYLLYLFSSMVGLQCRGTKDNRYVGAKAVVVSHSDAPIPDSITLTLKRPALTPPQRPTIGDKVVYCGKKWKVLYEKKGKLNSVDIIEVSFPGFIGPLHQLFGVDYKSELAAANKKNPLLLEWSEDCVKPPITEEHTRRVYDIIGKMIKMKYVDNMNEILLNHHEILMNP